MTFMEKRKLAWDHSSSYPRLPVTGRRGYEVSLPRSSSVVRHHRQFEKRYILVRNSLFSTVPTLISSSLQMNFWYDRPIFTATNHKQQTTNRPLLPLTRRLGYEPSASCVVPQSPPLWMLVHLGQDSFFPTVPALITSTLQMNFWDSRPISPPPRNASVIDVLNHASSRSPTAPLRLPTMHHEPQTTNHEQKQHFRSFSTSMDYLPGER
jgi:hypothetical protein